MLGGLADVQGVSAPWHLKPQPTVHSSLHFMFSRISMQYFSEVATAKQELGED